MAIVSGDHSQPRSRGFRTVSQRSLAAGVAGEELMSGTILAKLPSPSLRRMLKTSGCHSGKPRRTGLGPRWLCDRRRAPGDGVRRSHGRPVASGRSAAAQIIAAVRAHWPLLLVLLAFALSAVIVPTLAPVATTDDWAYTRSSQILLQEGRLTIFPVVAATAVFQIVWGALFSLIFGPTLRRRPALDGRHHGLGAAGALRAVPGAWRLPGARARSAWRRFSSIRSSSCWPSPS